MIATHSSNQLVCARLAETLPCGIVFVLTRAALCHITVLHDVLLTMLDIHTQRKAEGIKAENNTTTDTPQNKHVAESHTKMAIQIMTLTEACGN